MSESEGNDRVEELQKLVTAKEEYIKELLADKDNRNADLLHRLECEREACAEDRGDLTALVQELQARLTAKKQELEDSCALIKRQDEKLTAYETTIRELRCSLDKSERHTEVDPEKKIEEEEKRKKNIQRLMDEHEASRKVLRTAKTLRPYAVEYRGWKFTIPAGSTVSNSTANGYDNNYRFWTRFEPFIEELTGYKNSMLAHDLTYYGINIPAEYCEPYLGAPKS